jgi:hypothetical protein
MDENVYAKFIRTKYMSLNHNKFGFRDRLLIGYDGDCFGFVYDKCAEDYALFAGEECGKMFESMRRQTSYALEGSKRDAALKLIDKVKEEGWLSIGDIGYFSNLIINGLCGSRKDEKDDCSKG